MEILDNISSNLQIGKLQEVKNLVTQALGEGIPAADILNGGLLAGMSVIGEKFKRNEIFVPQVLVAARCMNQGVDILKPHLVSEGVRTCGVAVIGTVLGDLHDIGKNLVKLLFEGKGITVIDLGVNVAPETFIQKAVEFNADIICCSALLTTTMGSMKDVVEKAKEAGIRDKVKIMVGGAPVSQAFCDSIGADIYTSDAASAADAAYMICTNK